MNPADWQIGVEVQLQAWRATEWLLGDSLLYRCPATTRTLRMAASAAIEKRCHLSLCRRSGCRACTTMPNAQRVHCTGCIRKQVGSVRLLPHPLPCRARVRLRALFQ